MKSLPVLLRIAKRDLDLLRRALGEQQAKAQQVEMRIQMHEQTILQEQQAALRDYESQRAYGGYAIVALATREAMKGERAAIEQESERLRALISEAHVEMRKFERLLELQEERDRKAREKREDDELDEMATLRAGRQK